MIQLPKDSNLPMLLSGAIKMAQNGSHEGLGIITLIINILRHKYHYTYKDIASLATSCSGIDTAEWGSICYEIDELESSS